MKSIYDDMDYKELDELSSIDWKFHRKGNDLERAKRDVIHKQLLEEGGDIKTYGPRTYDGVPRVMSTRPYSRYSSPPTELLEAFNEEEKLHWFPELFQYTQENGSSLKISRIRRELTNTNALEFQIHCDNSAVKFQYHYWPGCCAMSMLSNLDCWGRFADPYSAVSKHVALRIVPMMRSLTATHQIMFAYSEEEITCQNKVWKSWGGIDVQSPYTSYKTGNTIHTAAIDLANAHDIKSARNRASDNADVREDYEED